MLQPGSMPGKWLQATGSPGSLSRCPGPCTEASCQLKSGRPAPLLTGNPRELPVYPHSTQRLGPHCSQRRVAFCRESDGCQLASEAAGKVKISFSLAAFASPAIHVGAQGREGMIRVMLSSQVRGKEGEQPGFAEASPPPAHVTGGPAVHLLLQQKLVLLLGLSLACRQCCPVPASTRSCPLSHCLLGALVAFRTWSGTGQLETSPSGLSHEVPEYRAGSSLCKGSVLVQRTLCYPVGLPRTSVGLPWTPKASDVIAPAGPVLSTSA